MHRKLSSSAFGLFLGIITVAFSACGPAATASNGALTSGSPVISATTTTAAVTATPAGPTTSLPTVDKSSIPAGCSNAAVGLAPAWQPTIRLGDLLMSPVAPGMSYPSVQIPQSIATRPLQLTGPMARPASGTAPVNPTLKGLGGLTFVICNTSASLTDTVQSVSVRVASFTPYSGALGAWNPCHDGSFEAQSQTLVGGGCGGGLAVNELLNVGFAADAGVGATLTATQVSTYDIGPGQPNPFPPLPLALKPGQSILVTVGITAPAAPGTYTFALGLAVNTAAPVFFSTSAPVLLAPVTTHWSGQNCEATAIKAQIPAATQPTYYICPPAA